jgi:predicted acetyltransferase
MKPAHGETAVGNVAVIPALPEHEPILGNLLELYAHDFSEFHDVALGEDGRFGYEHLPLYWREPDRHPFLVRVDGQLAGFVLVKRGDSISGNGIIWDMAEFFILRRYRRHGIGTIAAYQVWKRFPGRWEVRVMGSNAAGLKFWKRAISAFVGKRIKPIRVEQSDRRWSVFTFDC